MKVDLERLSATSVKLTVNLPQSELEPAFASAYKRIGEQVKIPGFRAGKVPASIIDQRVGRGAVLEEAINEAVPRAYEQALMEQNLHPVGRPNIDITDIADGSHVAFTAEVEVRPEFEIPAFDTLRIEVDAVSVDPARLDEQIDALRARFGTYKPVERAAADGDVLLVDIAGEVDGVEVADLTANALSYELGTDGMLPGFDAAVRGAAVDETREFTFTPESGPEAGKVITVKATVRAVRERELPELNDDFAQLASEFDTVADLRADVEQRLARLARLEQGYQARDRVQQALLDAIDLPMPEAALAAEIADHFQDGHGDDAHRAEFEQNSRNSMKAQFIFDKIAEQENLQVSDQELSAWLVQQAPRYGMNPQEFADALVKSGGVGMAVSDVRRAKAVEVVLQSVQVVDSNGQVVDLSALDEDIAAYR